MSYKLFSYYASAESLTMARASDMLLKLIPEFAHRGKAKRQAFINCFEEVLLQKGTLLEQEGQPPKYFWIIIEGDIALFKRPESLYHDGKVID